MELRAEEISQIIRKQIEDYDQKVSVQETGTVLMAGDGIARVYGLSGAMAGETLDFPHGIKGIVLNLEEDNVGVALLGNYELIREGDVVKRTGQIDPRGTAGAVVACGTILLVGGESQATDEVLADVFALDGDTWVPLQPLLTPRSFARTVVLDDAVYVVGGSTEYGSSHASRGSSAVERFTTEC